MNKYKHKLKMPRRPFFPKPSLFATAKEHAISPPDPQTLNDLDKIYLLLCEQNLQEWFNLLCYELRIRNLSVLDKIDDEFLKKFRLIPNFAKEQLKQLFKTAQRTTNYVDLALKYGKTPYRQRLESAGVPLIPVEEIRVVRKVASGPVSGAICDAVWVKPDGKRFRVCLRYDREQSQRLHFLQEAEISASLDHENILHVYGVVLPGSYTNSVALVVDFSAYGNIQEAISQLSVYSLVKITAQLASALRYLESKKLVHFRITAASIFLMAQDKIQLGGMWGCFPENQLRANKTSSESNSLSSEVVFFYGQICKDLFRQLAFHRFGMGLSSKFQQKQKVLCPDVLGALFDKCCSKNANARPSFSQIEKTLSTFALPKLRVTSDISGQSRHDLTCAKDEIILLVSKTVPRDIDDHNSCSVRWLGENRSGSIGLFDPAKTQETPHFADDEWLLPEEQRGEKGPDSSKTEADNEKDSSVPPEIQARGVEAEHAFQRALKKGKVSVYRGRVMLVGQNRAGKTSLKKSLLGIQFDPGEPSTEGVEVDPSKFEVDTHRVINWQMVKNEKFTSEFAEDIARLVVGELRCPEKEQKSSSLPTTQELPQERVEAPPVEETEEVTTDQSLEGIAVTSLNPVEDFNSDLLEDPELHLDIETSTGVPEDVISLVTKYLQTQQEEQRADTRETVVTIWDFAGQHLYYASHPVFLSPRAVYVLVYNMSKDLNAKMEPCVRQGVHDFIPHSSGDETNLDSILSWLVSIHNLSPEIRGQERRQNNDQPYLRPPVIVVGTHIDRPFEDPKRMEALIKKNLTGKSYEQHVRRPFFRVDNTRSQDEEGVKKLRCEVKEVLNLEPYMGEDVPVRWFNFEKVVEALVQQKTFYLKVAQLYNIVRKVCYIDDETEMAAMLDFYHDLGIIIWHGDTVVLETRWLINLFRKLITIRPFDEQNPRHAAAWNELEQTGLLSMHLVGHVFAEFLCDGQSQSDILGMMEMYGLIAKFTPDSDSDLSQQQSTVKYFVPAQLGSCPQTEVETSAVDVCPLFINFLDGFLPHGLFPQLVSRFIRGSRELGCKDAPNLFQNLVRFIIGKNDLFLICKQSFIKVILRKVSSVSPANDEEGTAALVRESLEKILRSLSRDFPCLRNMRYELCVACPSCPKQNRVCVKHRVASCTHDGCIHLLPITLEERLICTRTFGDQSRVEVPGAEKWQPVNNKRGNTSPVLPDLLPSGEVSDKTDALPEEKPRPEVFISYQWDLQDTVRVLQSKLEEAGFRCWMDIMHMGGGDSLYAEIDAGIRAAKVFISCVTKRYCQSEMCQREVTLADNLRKPIIPLLFEFIQWPPAGQLALIFTKLLYIDMTQGTELLPENKLRELRAKIQGHVEQ